MAIIECLVLRQGITPITIKEHLYEFQPIPGAGEYEDTTSVCNIANQDAVNYLLGNVEKNLNGRPNFRLYKPAQAQADMAERRRSNDATAEIFKGWAIDPIYIGEHSKGYYVVHTLPDGTKEFHGVNGKQDDPTKLIAFFKITDADTYLRATVAGTPVESAMAFKKYPCMEFGCVEGFDNPKDLAAHYEAVHESTEAAAQPVAGAAPAAERLSAMLEQKTAGYKHVPGEVKA